MLQVGVQLSQEAMSDNNQFAEYIEHAGGLQKLEQLTFCDGDVSQKATHLIERFFSSDEEARLQSESMFLEDSSTPMQHNQNQAPPQNTAQNASSQNFSFGASKFQFKF
mmetsp:Transcript_24499/g.31173  ORF Transcript_24499/g.31173 Transcript_24499/m.31173 type:complete len:109 (-) Transcript_24499:62-388(-)